MCIRTYVEENIEKYSGLTTWTLSFPQSSSVLPRFRHRWLQCLTRKSPGGPPVPGSGFQMWSACMSRAAHLELHMYSYTKQKKNKTASYILRFQSPTLWLARMSHILCPWYQHFYRRVTLLFQGGGKGMHSIWTLEQYSRWVTEGSSHLARETPVSSLCTWRVEVLQNKWEEGGALPGHQVHLQKKLELTLKLPCHTLWLLHLYFSSWDTVEEPCTTVHPRKQCS